MTLREQIITLADTYAEASGIGRKRMSTIVFNRGAKLDDIVDGGDLATGTFERALQWFSDNWPEGVAWPDAGPLPRPEPTKEAA
ncbi:hypothetical protein ATY81_12395 [Rhizobium sp. R72]|uniref:hypothetical protein n=1 Tax=unclassified Rhizobium TaxID=2613769 RepID=UPI000B52A915|nr:MULTISPECIES: hypothetical protein [unclassified Rhizobium]OWV94245.1 hypothetical protein ATY81_12395 [Rhizobium sp. R72]OWV94515.1 hypothetical protein ATY80_12395 [Rhizobium sp. R711]